MNVNTLLAALTLSVSAAAPGLAAAAPAMQDAGMARVEVHADLNAPTPGYASRGEAYSESVPVSTRSRAEVVAELRTARATGLMDQRGELYGSFIPGQNQSTMSRSAVMAQAPIDAARFEQQYAGS